MHKCTYFWSGSWSSLSLLYFYITLSTYNRSCVKSRHLLPPKTLTTKTGITAGDKVHAVSEEDMAATMAFGPGIPQHRSDTHYAVLSLESNPPTESNTNETPFLLAWGFETLYPTNPSCPLHAQALAIFHSCVSSLI